MTLLRHIEKNTQQLNNTQRLSWQSQTLKSWSTQSRFWTSELSGTSVCKIYQTFIYISLCQQYLPISMHTYFLFMVLLAANDWMAIH